MKQKLFFFLLFVFPLWSYSQTDTTSMDTTSNSGILKIFLKCDYCDLQFMKQELPYLNYVRDRKLAQVQIIVTTQGTASGGEEYTLQFLGLNEFENMQDTLKFSILPNSAENIQRTTMNQYILLGLTRFIAKTPYAAEWMVSYSGETDNQDIKDKWDFWVFNLSAYGWFNGEAYYKSKNIYGEISASRTTNERKIEFSFNNNYNKNNYRIDDSTEFVSLFKSYYAEASYVHSLNDHWSAGLDAEYSSSIFSNMKFNLFNSVLFEYNIFPYSESTRKQWRFYYKAGPRFDQYYDTTVLLKTKMTWSVQETGMYVRIIKEWGSFDTWISYTTMLNDFRYWSASISSEASFNLFKGFNLNLSANVSFIQNQVSLRLDEATDSEILLRQVQVPTDFRYWCSMGFSYTFGSIYNNIVNPRLD